LEIGTCIGKHHIESDPTRLGLQQPIAQAKPPPVETTPSEEPQVLELKVTRHQW
jgi:hypothetical protein